MGLGGGIHLKVNSERHLMWEVYGERVFKMWIQTIVLRQVLLCNPDLNFWRTTCLGPKNADTKERPTLLTRPLTDS